MHRKLNKGRNIKLSYIKLDHLGNSESQFLVGRIVNRTLSFDSSFNSRKILEKILFKFILVSVKIISFSLFKYYFYNSSEKKKATRTVLKFQTEKHIIPVPHIGET